VTGKISVSRSSYSLYRFNEVTGYRAGLFANALMTIPDRFVGKLIGETNAFFREIHTGMPVSLREEHHDSWLSGEAGKEVLVPYPADRMKAWPINSRVNSPKNDDAEIVVPIDIQSLARSENQPQLL